MVDHLLRAVVSQDGHWNCFKGNGAEQSEKCDKRVSAEILPSSGSEQN